MVEDTYRNFQHPSVAPLKLLDHNQWILELFHGPTLAFKDYPLQLVGRLFDYVLKKKGQKATIVGLPPQAEGRNMRVGPLGIPEIAIIVVVILLIFGAKRLPEIGTSMGKGIRTFKTALMGDDEKDEAVRGKDDSNS